MWKSASSELNRVVGNAVGSPAGPCRESQSEEHSPVGGGIARLLSEFYREERVCVHLLAANRLGEGVWTGWTGDSLGVSRGRGECLSVFRGAETPGDAAHFGKCATWRGGALRKVRGVDAHLLAGLADELASTAGILPRPWCIKDSKEASSQHIVRESRSMPCRPQMGVSKTDEETWEVPALHIP